MVFVNDKSVLSLKTPVQHHYLLIGLWGNNFVVLSKNNNQKIENHENI